jgi:hypothetical protein
MTDKTTASIFIYGLYESDQPVANIRYIGQAVNPRSRLTSHRNDKASTPKTEWIKGVQCLGRTINMVILDTADGRAQAHAKENAWILFAQRLGWNLVNGTKPGERRDLISSDMSMAEEAMMQVAQYAEQLSQMSNLVDVTERAYKEKICGLSEQVEGLQLQKASIESVVDREKRKLQRYRNWQKIARQKRDIKKHMIYAGMVLAATFLLAFTVFMSDSYTKTTGEVPHDLIGSLLTICAGLVALPFVDVFIDYYKRIKSEVRSVGIQHKYKLAEHKKKTERLQNFYSATRTIN